MAEQAVDPNEPQAFCLPCLFDMPYPRDIRKIDSQHGKIAPQTCPGPESRQRQKPEKRTHSKIAVVRASHRQPRHGYDHREEVEESPFYRLPGHDEEHCGDHHGKTRKYCVGVDIPDKGSKQGVLRLLDVVLEVQQVHVVEVADAEQAHEPGGNEEYCDHVLRELQVSCHQEIGQRDGGDKGKSDIAAFLSCESLLHVFPRRQGRNAGHDPEDQHGPVCQRETELLFGLEDFRELPAEDPPTAHQDDHGHCQVGEGLCLRLEDIKIVIVVDQREQCEHEVHPDRRHGLGECCFVFSLPAILVFCHVNQPAP